VRWKTWTQGTNVDANLDYLYAVFARQSFFNNSLGQIMYVNTFQHHLIKSEVALSFQDILPLTLDQFSRTCEKIKISSHFHICCPPLSILLLSQHFSMKICCWSIVKSVGIIIPWWLTINHMCQHFSKLNSGQWYSVGISFFYIYLSKNDLPLVKESLVKVWCPSTDRHRW